MVRNPIRLTKTGIPAMRIRVVFIMWDLPGVLGLQVTQERRLDLDLMLLWLRDSGFLGRLAVACIDRHGEKM